MFGVARVGRSWVVLGPASAATCPRGLLDLELGDVWLVAVGQWSHPLLLVLLVGAAPLRYHRLAPIAALLKIVGAVGHAATLGRMERTHSSVLMVIAAGQRALLGGEEVLSGRDSTSVDPTGDLAWVPRRTQRWLLRHPVGSGAMSWIGTAVGVALGTAEHGSLGRRRPIVPSLK